MDQKPIINIDIIDIQTPNNDPKINQNEFFMINPIKKIINDTNKRKLNTSQSLTTFSKKLKN
jgi:hypothetical protein